MTVKAIFKTRRRRRMLGLAVPLLALVGAAAVILPASAACTTDANGNASCGISTVVDPNAPSGDSDFAPLDPADTGGGPRIGNGPTNPTARLSNYGTPTGAGLLCTPTCDVNGVHAAASYGYGAVGLVIRAGVDFGRYLLTTATYLQNAIAAGSLQAATAEDATGQDSNLAAGGTWQDYPLVLQDRAGFVNTPSSGCTGFAVAPDRILTAAHCVYNFQSRSVTQAGNITYQPGNKSSIVCHGTGVYVPPAYVNNPGVSVFNTGLTVLNNSDNDWAVVAFSDCNGLPYFALDAKPNVQVPADVAVLGALSDSPEGKLLLSTGHYAKSLQEIASLGTPNTLNTDIRIKAGFSGGPLLYRGKVIGINSNANAFGTWHTRINGDVYRAALVACQYASGCD